MKKQLAVLAVLGLAAVSCGSDDAAEPDAGSTPAAQATEAPATDTAPGATDGGENPAPEATDSEDVTDDTEPSATGGPAVESISVGIIAPYTVKAAFVGPNVQSGAELAVEQIEAAGGPSVELIAEDDQGALEPSLSALEKLTSVDDVDMVVGPTSLTIISLLDRVKEDSTLHMIAVGSTSSLDQEMADTNIFRVVGSDTLAGPAMALTAQDLGFTECAYLFEDQESAQSVRANVEAAWETVGGTSGSTVNIAVGQPSYRSEALDLFEESPECIFFQMEPENAASFFSSAAEFSAELSGTTFVSTDVALAEEMVSAMGPALDEGTQLYAVAPASDGDGRDQFVAAYTEKFGSEPEVFADTAYDAVNLYALAVAAAGSSDLAAVQAALPEMSEDGTACLDYAECIELLNAGEDIDYQGASGSVDFDELHDVKGAFGVYETQDGQQPQTALVTEDRIVEVAEQVAAG